jgi:hypothetical protein
MKFWARAVLAFVVFLVVGLLYLVALVALVSVPAAAQGPAQCAPRPVVLANLGMFEHTKRTQGLTMDGVVMEVYAAQNGLWAMFTTDTKGMTCLVANGTSYETIMGAGGVRG